MAKSDIIIELDLRADGLVITAKNVDRVIRQLERSFNRTDRTVKGLQRSFGGLLPTLTRMVTTLGLARHAIMNLHSVTSQWVMGIINANAELERMEMLLRGMSKAPTTEGAIREAAKDMQFLIEMARTAPFSLKEMGNTMVKMKSVGIDPTAGAMRSLADAVANFGGTDQILHRATVAIQQMAGKGVISMEELRQQLGEAVPNAMMLMARSMGVSVRELVDQISRGTVAAKPALKRLFIEFELAMGGSTQRMMKTWVGMTQRMKVSWSLFLKEVGDAGMFEEAKKALQDLTDLLDSDQARDFAQDLGAVLADVISGLRKMMEWLKNNIHTIQELGKVALQVFGAMIAGTIASKVIVAFSALQRVLLSVIGTLTLVGTKSAVMSLGMVGAIKASGGLKAAITSMLGKIGAFVLGLKKGKNALGALKAVGMGVVNVLKFLATRFAAFAGPVGIAVTALVMFKDSIPGLNDLIGWLVKKLQAAVSWITNIGKSAEDTANRIIESAGKATAAGDTDRIRAELGEMNRAIAELIVKRDELKNSKGLFEHFPGPARRKAAEIAQIEQAITDLKAEQNEKRLRLEQALAMAEQTLARRTADEKIRTGKLALDAALENIRNESNVRLRELETQLAEGEISKEDYWKERTEAIRNRYLPMIDLVQAEIANLLKQIAVAEDADVSLNLQDQFDAMVETLDRFKTGLKNALEVQKDVSSKDWLGTDGTGGAGPKYNAFEKYFQKLNGDIEETKANIAGLDGAWAEFQYHANQGKFKGLVSDSDRAKVKDLIAQYEKLTAQHKLIKEQRNELKQTTKKLVDIESDLDVRIGQMYETMQKGYTTTSSAMRSLEVMRQHFLKMKPASEEAAEGIKKVVAQLDELVAKQSILDDFANSRKAADKFRDDMQSQAQLTEARMNLARNRGAISEIEYMQERQVFARDYIALLEQEITLLQKAGASESEINAIRAEIIGISKDLTLVADMINEKIGGAFDTAFEDILNGTKSFKDIFTDLFDNIFREINSMVAKDLSAIFQREVLGRGSEGGGLGGFIAKMFDFGRGGTAGGKSGTGLMPQEQCQKIDGWVMTLNNMNMTLPTAISGAISNGASSIGSVLDVFSGGFTSSLDMFDTDFANSVDLFNSNFASVSNTLVNNMASIFASSGSGGGLSSIGGNLIGSLFSGSGSATIAADPFSSTAIDSALAGNLFGFRKGGIMSHLGEMQLNKYASGGIANTPQLSYFGEGSTPEAYVPLPDGRAIPVRQTGGKIERFEMHIHGVKDARTFRESEPNIIRSMRRRLGKSAAVDS